MGGFVLP